MLVNICTTTMQFVNILIVFSCFMELGSSILTEQEYAQIPRLHDMDDFPACLKENKIVCRVYFDIVQPNNTSNNAWNIIQKSRSDLAQFPKNKLKRFRCLPNSFAGKDDDIVKSLVSRENELLKNYSLQVNIQEFYCRSYPDIQLTTFDYAVLFSTIGLIVIVISATIMDIWLDASGLLEVIIGKTAVKYIKYFSMISNWKALIRSTSIDGQKLKAMQGVRVLSTICVINVHIMLTLVTICFVENTRFVEELLNKAQMGFVFGMYVVQISFLISGWLLANSVYKYVTKTEDFTAKDVIHLIAYRYLRLFPLMFILQCWEWSNWFYVKGSLPYDFMEMDRIGCKKYWWRSLLLINNFSNGSDHCNASLWSLANDFQMYAISVCLFYIIFKYKKNLMLFVYMTGICCSIHGYEMYRHGYQHLIAFAGLKDLDTAEIFKTDEFYVMYSALYVNFGSYAVGVIFGSFYNGCKNIKIKNNLRNNLLWACFMFVLPAIIIYMSTFTYSTLWAAMIAPFVKPTISLCLSIGIFGMTFGLGGFFRRFCESDFIQLIASLQYSVYQGHWWVVFSRLFTIKRLFYFSVFNMVLNSVCDIIGAYLFGLLIYLLIEKPFLNIVYSIMFPTATKDVRNRQVRKSK